MSSAQLHAAPRQPRIVGGSAAWPTQSLIFRLALPAFHNDVPIPDLLTSLSCPFIAQKVTFGTRGKDAASLVIHRGVLTGPSRLYSLTASPQTMERDPKKSSSGCHQAYSGALNGGALQHLGLLKQEIMPFCAQIPHIVRPRTTDVRSGNLFSIPCTMVLPSPSSTKATRAFLSHF